MNMDDNTKNTAIMARITSKDDPLSILIVEDSKGDALLIEKALNIVFPASYTLKKATTLESALKLVSENNFDITLLDRSLPDVEGFNGLHSIQNMAPELPIVFLTAYKDEQFACEAIEQGAQDYLYKDSLDGHVIKRAIQYAILRKQFEGVLIMRANFDMLTGLANRMLYESRLDMALAKMRRQDSNLAVLFLDLDNFKEVNDTYGHATGDQLLKEVGKRLKASLRPYDTAARFGGDEFAILLEDIAERQHVEAVAKKVIEKLELPITIAAKQINAGVSIGISMCTAKQNLNAEALIKQADKAMYEAKSVSGSNYRYYTAPSNELANAQT
ncbi:MAG: diguanylate cyclase domain-containing protein [Rickettsiales bacterium]